MISYSSLKSLLLSNIAEIRYVRRLPTQQKGNTRRMWCTNSVKLLNSFNGINILNYRVPKVMPKFNPNEKNIIITWDILMQDFRCVNMDSCDLLQSMPDDDKFWEYFNENIYVMSTQQKISFMQS